MSKRLKITLLVVGGLVVLGGGVAAYSSRNRGVVSVIAAKVETQDIVSKVTANGKIQAENRVEMSALVQGQIVNLAVREGDQVKKGDFLLQIDRNRAAADEAGSNAALQGEPERPRLRQGPPWTRPSATSTGRRSNFEARIASEADFQKAQSGAGDRALRLRSARRTASTRRAPASAPTATRSRRPRCARPSTGS